METPIPRWEWRTFGESFGQSDDRFAALKPEKVQEGDELSELVKPSRRVRAVEVHKKRAHYTVNGCMAEMAGVVADGKTARTVAIESEDPARVIALVRELGLDRFENVNYPRGLKQLVGVKG